MNASTGALLWSYKTGGMIESSSPAVAKGVVYVGSFDNNVYALNASTGTLMWSFPAPLYVDSSPAVANGVVYVGSWAGNMYALNASTGAKLWNYGVGRIGGSSPAVVNGSVYVASRRGVLYAFGLKHSRERAEASRRPDLKMLRPDFNLKASGAPSP